jgi:hypothetical protein
VVVVAGTLVVVVVAIVVVVVAIDVVVVGDAGACGVTEFDSVDAPVPAEFTAATLKV